MLSGALDRPWLRIAVGVFLGIPLTAAALFGAIFGTIFFVHGLQDGEFWAIGLGLVAALGALGIAGAWWRLLRRHTAMSRRESIVVRVLLFSGIVSSIVLGAWAVQGEWAAAALLFGLLAIGGVALVLATPVAL
jgi:hypothetical protein